MRVSLALVLLLLVVPLPLLADGTQLGTIAGKVVDQTGAVLPGVTVEAVHTERGFSRSTVTDPQGQYILPLMQPGTYRVTLSLEGFDTFVAQNTVVAVEKTTELNAKLNVSKASETVTVQGEVPIVDKTNAALDTTIPSTLSQALPIARNYQNLALTAPGVVLPGNANANANFHGALSTDNLYLFDGIDTTDPTTGGFGQNFTFEAIQEVSVTTSAASADYGRATGGIINVVTKSGTNNIKGSYKEVMTNDEWNEQNKGVSPTSGVPFARQKFDSLVRVHSATLGGPLWRDHAWFFGAYEWDKQPSSQRQTLDPKTPQNFQSVPVDKFYDVKGTWQINPSNLLVLKANAAPTTDIAIDRHNGGINAIPRFAGDLGAMNYQDQASKSKALQYSGVVGTNLALEGGGAKSKIHIDFRPFAGDDPVHQDTSTGLFYNGPSIVGFLERARSQANVAGSYYHVIGGHTHTFKGGIDYQSVRSAVDQRFGGNQLFLDKSYNLATHTGVPNQRRDYDPSVESSSTGKNTALYFLDKFEIGSHVSLNLGLRGEKQAGQSDAGATIVDTTSISPRLSGTYDFRGDGKTLAVASYGRFYQNILQSFDDAFATQPPKSSYTVYNWDAATSQWINGGHVRVGGASVRVDNIDPTYIDEMTAGVEQQIGRNVGVGLRLIHRKWNDIIDDVFTVEGSGNIVRTFRNYDGARRSYTSLEATFERRFTSNWGAQVSYTYGRARGNQFGAISSDLGNFSDLDCRSTNDVTIGNGGLINCGAAVNTNRSGTAPFDRTHVIRAYTAYHLPIHVVNVTVAPALVVQSGDTYQRQGTLNVLGANGKPNGNTVTYYYSEAGSDRLPTIYQVDLAVEATRTLIHGVEAGLKGEIFNLNDQQRQIQASVLGWCNDTSTATCRTLQSQYGLGTSRNAYQLPRAYRITALLRF